MTEDQQRAAVIAEAKTWNKTPFRHMGRLKGLHGGVDCGQFIACVFENAGITPKIDPGSYQFQHHMHSSREDYIRQLSPYTREIAESEIKMADIVLYKCGRTFSHGALIIDQWPGLIIHSRNPLGVEYSNGTTCGFLKGRERRFFSYWGKEISHEPSR